MVQGKGVGVHLSFARVPFLSGFRLSVPPSVHRTPISDDTAALTKNAVHLDSRPPRPQICDAVRFPFCFLLSAGPRVAVSRRIYAGARGGVALSLRST